MAWIANYTEAHNRVNSRVITRNDLIEYCVGKDITKTEYEDLLYRIPMGANLLNELEKCDIKSKYITQLLREKKLKRILEQNN